MVTTGIQGEAVFASGPTPVADVANVFIRGSTTALHSHLVFFVRSTHDNLQRLVRQGTLERLCFIPRRTHPHFTLLFVRRAALTLGFWVSASASLSLRSMSAGACVARRVASRRSFFASDFLR